VLAALLLRAEDVVPVERLIDEVWGDDPPRSATHSLEAYVSRLRRCLAPHGATVERRLDGYRLDLGDAILDARVFETLVEEASEAASEPERAAALAEQALALWRGPLVAGVPLHLDARAEREWFDELRLRAIEIRAAADLALGREDGLAGDLRRLVEEHPYREQLVAQLMIALYRSGRQAEALEAYEKTRRRLMDDLGIHPGPELQRLSGEIVRQEATLSTPAARADGARVAPRRRTALAFGLLAALAAAALVAIAVTRGHGGRAAADTAAPPPRVALILPRAPRAGREDTFVTPLVDGLRRAAQNYDVDTKTLVLDEDPDPAAIDRIGRRLRAGGFDLVLSAGLGPWSGSALLPVVSRLPHTRFVYLDASLSGTQVEWSANATGVPFADSESGYLAGYLSGLMTRKRRPLQDRPPMVSVVAGHPVPSVTSLVRSFIRGARTAHPEVLVRVDYAYSFTDQSICERLANKQIDRGSSVVFAPAGTCGLGALAAAEIRGVWGVAADMSNWHLGSHILASTVKRYDRAVELAVRWFIQGTLPRGDVVLGLDDEAVGIASINPEVPGDVRKRLADVEAAMRANQAAPGS
jgi:basic membrane lipoprotein Med (substrate-binding protein (PBP1-ABC) superfamily)/DNA-binding SARP family transcriptional activator